MSEVTYQLNKEMSSVLEYLQTVTPVFEAWGVEVATNHNSGTLYLKGRDIIAAQYGPLVGNGALLTIAGWKNQKIRRIAERAGRSEKYYPVPGGNPSGTVPPPSSGGECLFR